MAMLLGIASCRNEAPPEDSGRLAAIQKGYAFQVTADSLMAFGEKDAAFAKYIEARAAYEKGGDSLLMANVLLRMSFIYHEYNDYTEMQSVTVEAMKLIRDTDSLYQKSALMQLGISEIFLGNSDAAVAHFLNCRKYITEPYEELLVQNNIATAYHNAGQYEKAYGYLKRAMSSPHLADTAYVKGLILDNFGYCAYRLGKKEAAQHLLEALKLREASRDTLRWIASCLNLAEGLSKENPEQALSYALKAEELSSLNGSDDDRLLALKYLIEHHPNQNSYAKTYIRVNDSLRDSRQKSRNAFAALRYNYSVERQQKLELEAAKAEAEAEASQQALAKFAWLGTAILLLFSAVVTVVHLRRKAKLARIEATYDTEVRISQRLHDELANEAHQAILLAETQDLSKPGQKENILELLDTVYRRARGISRENGAVPPGEDFGIRLNEVIAPYSAVCQIVISGLNQVPWIQFPEEVRIAVYRSIQELLVNMKKYSGCTHAIFRFGTSDSQLEITYSDNGKGCSLQEKKNGLSIMENRISAIGGSIRFESADGKGFRAVIKLPI